METKIQPLSDYWKNCESKGIKNQITMRTTPLQEWLTHPLLKDRLSGTLKKNASVGFKYLEQLKNEAICQTLGWGFQIMKSTYITFNDAITEEDCPPLTEVGWHTDRLLNIHPWEEDEFVLKYIIVQDKRGQIQKQGVGVVVKQTSIQWIGSGNLVFALLTEYNPISEEGSPCTNPF